MTTTDPDERLRAEVSVHGTVQGVGFRPFVYRTALEHDLDGWVRNTGDAGVDVVLEGAPDAVEGFLAALRQRPPPLASVDSVAVERGASRGEAGFEIRESASAEGGAGTIPPDTGVCEQCLADVRDPDSRYHGYWATACVDCGPRFTVVRGLPYDRPTTSMDEFPMCDACRAEYEAPADRRYHAQAIACPRCGPSLSLAPPAGEPLGVEDPVASAGDRLRGGELLAVKGIGGAHLACDATDPGAVERLRDRTGRPRKPFALMAPSMDAVESFAAVDDRERELLSDVRRPIVLLDRGGEVGAGVDPTDAGAGTESSWLEAVAPGLHTVGVMLPYSGLHHLLFDHVDAPLVMTSANLPGRPMCTTREAMVDQLGDVVDAMLLHDREIVARCDDSVVRVVDDGRRFVRRSRGWVPQPVDAPLGASPAVLALGGEFDTTVAVTRDDDVVPSQHVGDVDDPETVAFLRDAADHLTELLGVDPGVVACDRHPEFVTTDLARKLAEEADLAGPVRVQHHHAHAAGLLAEHDRERAVVVAADGTGYGADGTVWGGEVLDARLDGYDRVGGLSTFRLPGGEAAVRRPGRTIASLLDSRDDVAERVVAAGGAADVEEARTVLRQVRRRVNSPPTTSAGRLLDAVSALLGVRQRRGYQGEPAMALEAAAADGEAVTYDPPTTSEDGRRVVDAERLVADAADMADDHGTAAVAATVQRALATGLADLAVDAARDRGVGAVGFTGGVAYNQAISRHVRRTVETADLLFLGHEAVPPGDGGLAYGQAVVATHRSDGT
jgi:hydrogenase maturation protein HypF